MKGVVVDASVRQARRVRPKMRNVGVAHGVATAALVAVLAFGSLRGCDGVAVRVIPAGPLLVGLVAVAAVVMMVRLPRMSAVAPALALGASMSLLGGAAAGWMWVSTQPCMGNVLDREVVTLHIVTAAAAATMATSLWLLVARDEIEPWFGATGVVVSTAAALTVLTVVVGLSFTLHPQLSLASTIAMLTVPWVLAVAATGWLRPSPAVAVVVPAACQALWLLAR